MEADTIRIDFDSSIGFGSQLFNGWILSDIDDVVTGISVIDSAGQIPAVSFTGDSVAFNYSALSQGASSFVVVRLSLDPASAPEPAAFGLLALGLAGTGIWRRRRQRALPFSGWRSDRCRWPRR